MDNMNNLEKSTAHYCGQCKRKLPLDAFYFNKRQQCFDRYCKDCRKEKSRVYYQKKDITHSVTAPGSYPVITLTEDPELRGKLLLNALQVVKASVLRKNKKQREEEALKE